MVHSVDQTSVPAPITISLVPGDTAPRSDVQWEEIVMQALVITEQGTQSNLPLCDLHFVDLEGKPHRAILTGRQICWMAAAIRGVNMRNHGIAEP